MSTTSQIEGKECFGAHGARGAKSEKTVLHACPYYEVLVIKALVVAAPAGMVELHCTRERAQYARRRTTAQCAFGLPIPY